MSARLRFGTAITTVGAGIVLGLGAFVFGPNTERWLALGVGAALAILTAGAFLSTGRGIFQRGLDLLLVPLSIWTLVSARTIELPGHGASSALVKWFGFSAGAGIFVIGVLALVAHELRMEADLRWSFEQLTGQREASAENSGPVEAGEPAASEEPAAEPEPEPAAEPEPEPAAESEPEPTPSPEPAADSGPEPTASEPDSNGHIAGDGTGNGHREMWLTPVRETEASWQPSRRAGA